MVLGQDGSGLQTWSTGRSRARGSMAFEYEGREVAVPLDDDRFVSLTDLWRGPRGSAARTTLSAARIGGKGLEPARVIGWNSPVGGPARLIGRRGAMPGLVPLVRRRRFA